jgi:hypothetical protein
MAVVEEKQRGQVRCDIDWLPWTKPKGSVSLYRRGAPKGSYSCATARGLHRLLVIVGQRSEGIVERPRRNGQGHSGHHRSAWLLNRETSCRWYARTNDSERQRSPQ